MYLVTRSKCHKLLYSTLIGCSKSWSFFAKIVIKNCFSEYVYLNARNVLIFVAVLSYVFGDDQRDQFGPHFASFGYFFEKPKIDLKSIK